MSTIDPLKGSPGPAITSTSAGQTRAAKNVTPAVVSKSTSGDKVELSSAALVAGTDAPYDSSKVEQIKDAIASGKFKVDSEKVAAGLIDSVKSLIRDNA